MSVVSLPASHLENALNDAGASFQDTLTSIHSLTSAPNIPTEVQALYQERMDKFQEELRRVSILDALMLGDYIKTTKLQHQFLAYHGFSSKYLKGHLNEEADKNPSEEDETKREDQVLFLNNLLEAFEALEKTPLEDIPDCLEKTCSQMLATLDVEANFGDGIQSEIKNLFVAFEKKDSDDLMSRSARFYLDFMKLNPLESHNDLVGTILLSVLLQGQGYFPITGFSESPESHASAVSVGLEGNLEPLKNIITLNQIQSHLKLLSLQQTMRETQIQNEMLAASSKILGDIGSQDAAQKIEVVKSQVHQLWQESIVYFKEVADKYNSDAENGEDFAFVDFASDDDEERRQWYLFQVISTAKKFTYWATPAAFHYWTKLGFTFNNYRFEIFLSFHAAEKTFGGTVAATLCNYSRKMGVRNIDNLDVLCDNPLIIFPENDLEELREEYTEWLKKGTSKGLGLMQAMDF